MGLGNSVRSTFRTFASCVLGLTTAPIITDLPTIERHKAVRQRLHETHDRILFSLRQAEVPDFAAVHVLRRLRRWPTCCAFTGVVRLASRQDVARVVEMHYLFQAREISIVSVGLDEGWIGPLVDIAQGRHLHSRLVVWRQLEPSLIHSGGLAQ